MRKIKDYNCIGDAMAGHHDRVNNIKREETYDNSLTDLVNLLHYRINNRKREEKYDNLLTDLVNLVIAEVKANQEIKVNRESGDK